MSLEPTPLYGGNADFLDTLYEQYQRDPASVAARWRALFDGFGPPQPGDDPRARQAPEAHTSASAPPPVLDGDASAKQAAVSRLVQIWTNRGHLIANLDPLGLMQRPRPRVLELDYFGLTQADLEREFFTGSRIAAVPRHMKLRDILAQLEHIYAGPIGAGFAHVSDSQERLWLQDEFQAGRVGHMFSVTERRDLLWQLTVAEGLERYLHTKYVGQKRFSLEGADAFIALLDDLIQHCGVAGVEDRTRSLIV